MGKEHHYLNCEEQARFDAFCCLDYLFEVANVAYQLAMLKMHISESASSLQLERLCHPTHSSMIDHIELVMGMNPDFEKQNREEFENIKNVLGIKSSSTIA